MDGLGSASSPERLCSRMRIRDRIAARSCLLAQAYQYLWLVLGNDVYQQFTYVNHTIRA